MKRDLQRIMNTLYKQYVNKKRWHKVVMALAAVVVFCTTYALVLPAITLETKCGIEEHTHEAVCYEKVVPETTRTLACTYESLGVHVHTSECYDSESNLLCGMVDYVVHEHNEDCMDENGSVVCQLPVIEKHEHTDACYKIPEVIESTEVSHVHDESCYTTERGELTCQLEETEGYSHGESCYEQGELVCQLNEQEEHTHVPECYEKILICERQEEEAHQHTDDCYEQISVLNCGMEEVVQSEVTEPETVEPELICTEPVVPEHIHEESCFVTETADDPLTCTLTENHTHDELCYGTWNLICGKEEHTHTDECQKMEGLGNANVQGDEKLSASDVENVMLLDTADEETSVASAEEEIEGTIFAEGMLTATAWWKIVDDEFGYRTLIIGGDGPMPDFASNADQPWKQYATAFDLIDIRDGITCIGTSAFHWNRFNDLRIGTGVKKIKNLAFGYVYQKNGNDGISIRIPGNVETVEGGVFVYSSAFKEIIFEEGVKEIIGNPFLNYFRTLERVYFPVSLTKVTAFGGTYTYNCGVQSEFIVAEGNPVLYTDNGCLYKNESNKITLIGYPSAREATSLVISNIDAVAEGIFCASTNLKEVKILGTETRPITIEGGSLFRNSKQIKTVTLNEYVKINNASYFFQWCTSLDSINISNGATTSWYQSFDGASALTEFTLSKDIAWVFCYAFQGTYALEKLKYDSSNAGIEYNSFGTEYYPRFDLVIGNNVDRLNETPNSNRGFSTVASRAESVKFEGDNQITIDSGALKGAGAPLDELSGTVWVDTQGIVYLYDNTTKNAEVVYVSPGITNIVIPKEITPESGVTCTVTGIGKNAFMKADVIEAIFEDASSISKIANNAFANCTTLDCITDQKSNVEAKTVENAEQLFKNVNAQVTIGTKAFYNTALESNGTSGGGEDITIPGNAVSGNAISHVFSTETDGKSEEIIVTTSGQQLLTGQIANIGMTFNNPNPEKIKDKVIRIYFSATDDDYTKGLSETFVKTTEDGANVTVSINQVPDDSGAYYIEIQGEDLTNNAATMNIVQSHTFLSPSSDGGEMLIWIQIYDSKEAAKADANKIPENLTERNYLKIVWNTVKKEPSLNKKSSGTPVLTANKENVLTAEVHNLAFVLNSTMNEREIDKNDSLMTGFGLDLVKSIDYEDILNLPKDYYINPEVVTAINGGNYFFRVTNDATVKALFAIVNNEEIEICKISNSEQISKLAAIVENGNLILKWRQLNVSTSKEIDAKTMTLTYGDHIIFTTIESYKENEQVSFENTAKITANYTHDKLTKSAEASATKDLIVNAPNISLNKTVSFESTTRYWGEDVEYQITLSNTTAFTYPGVGVLSDSLTDGHYIKTESMEKMFADPMTGDILQITIENAGISKFKGTTSAIASNGNTPVTLTPENTGSETKYTLVQNDMASADSSGKILIKKTDGSITVDATIGNETTTSRVTGDNSLEAILNSLGFFIKPDTQYIVQWNHNTDLQGNTIIVHSIPATIKDSFMMLGSDWEVEHNSSYLYTGFNTAILYNNDQQEITRASLKDNYSISRESKLEKSVKVNGKYVNGEKFQIKSGDILDYTVKFTHIGKGDLKVLPIVDRIMGAQQLLVPVNKNADKDWAKELEKDDIYGDPGFEQYYILKPRANEYKGVWITEELYADSVNVDETAEGWDTLIKLYFADLSGNRNYSKNVTYKTLVAPEKANITAMHYSIKNYAWANDHQGYRLYDTVLGDGTRIQFEKDIVVDKGTTPSEDKLDEDDHSIILKRNRVTYRLDLNALGGIPANLNGREIYDALPNTQGKFSWDNSNVSITYAVDEGVTINGEDLWSIESQPLPVENEEEKAQQYICWNENFNINYEAGSKKHAYIYVTLTFPDSDVWEDFFLAHRNSQDQLENILYVYNLPSKVTHELGDVGKAMLQKGVYKISAQRATAQGEWDTSSPHEETILDTRKLYSNTDSRVRLITYYTVLCNTGNTRLYINDLYDELPINFKFETLIEHCDIATAQSKIISDTEKEKSKALLNIDDANVEFVRATINAEIVDDGTEDGHQRLKYTLSDGDLEYDDSKGKYYLKPGQAVRFGYVVSTGSFADGMNVDQATNTIVMAYDDYIGGGLNVDQNTQVNVKELNELDTNDGTREVWTNAQVSNYKFGQPFAQQWLASQVTVEKGIIIPGITKKADSYYNNGSQKPYENNVGYEDIVYWKSSIYNDGQLGINGYVISDIMESPYKFYGNVNLSIYQGQTEDSPKWLYPSNECLFSLGERRYVEENGQKKTLVKVKYQGNKYKELTIGKETDIGVSFNLTSGFMQGNIKVLLEEIQGEDKKTHEKLSLIFDGQGPLDDMFSIPEKGMAVLEVGTKHLKRTENEILNFENKSYANQVFITPLNQSYSADMVNTGHNGVWPENNGIYNNMAKKPYVGNSALVNVANGYYTTAKKAVFEIGNENNRGECNTLNNCIVLKDKKSEFTYELSVSVIENTLENLIVIDNLPCEDDKLTYSSTADRGSEFLVNLSETPNFKVTVQSENNQKPVELASEYYTIEYSTQKKTDFTKNDMEGEPEAYWIKYDSENVKETDIVSLRFLIHNSEGENPVIPENATVKIYFDAKVNPNAGLGKVAWNNFGYTYSIKSSPDGFLSSSPEVVGVRIPGVPSIQKKLVYGKDNDPYKVESDTEFDFLIYEGDVIDFAGMDETAIAERLQERDVSCIALTVPIGGCESVPVLLDQMQKFTYDFENKCWKAGPEGSEGSEGWSWISGETYSVVELPLNENSLYVAKNIQINGSDNFTFTYSETNNINITAFNEPKTGKIMLLKQDSEKQNVYLSDAIFAIYSPSREDGMDSEKIESVRNELGLEFTPDLTKEYSVADNDETTTYYLMDIKKTNESGSLLWDDLLRNQYLLQELKAPNGYNLDDTIHIVENNVNIEQQIVTITNEAGYALPESGGIGISGMTTGGAAFMLTAAAGVLINNKITPKKRKKGGEQ